MSQKVVTLCTPKMYRHIHGMTPLRLVKKIHPHASLMYPFTSEDWEALQEVVSLGAVWLGACQVPINGAVLEPDEQWYLMDGSAVDFSLNSWSDQRWIPYDTPKIIRNCLLYSGTYRYVGDGLCGLQKFRLSCSLNGEFTLQSSFLNFRI